LKQETLESMVLDIKDKSELMVDLSYSSLLYNNKTIAKEVYELEELIDRLFEKLHHDLFKEVKEGSLSVKTAQTLMKLARAGEEIADAAREIADVQLREVELHPIIQMSIRESDEVITKILVKEESVLCRKTLGQLKLRSETGMTILAMRHKNRWLYGPNKNTTIDPNDILFAKGPEDGEAHLIELAEGLTNEI
jgi:uncharacterized protein with PhoU and TrkA domain